MKTFGYYGLKMIDDHSGGNIVFLYHGSLVRCLDLARKYHKRLGMLGDIYRPDGSSLRRRAIRANLP